MSWNIKTENDGTLAAESLAPPVPTNTRGEAVQLEFRFNSQSTYTTLREYLDFAGTTVTGTSLTGVPYFRELQTDEHGLVMGFEPQDTIPTVTGFWGVLIGGQELSTLPPADLALELDVFYLAELSEYSTISNVRSVFEK